MKIKANAKINISLSILGKRKDGYHLIDTVMHSVGLFDEIEIEKSSQLQVVCENFQIKEKDNIAYKAAKSFFETFEISGGAKIVINKNIPAAAGLGGGSADAAAVLLGLNSLYNADISEEKLCEVALKLGADVPFFIKGGCQRCEGIGEILTPIKPLRSGYLLLAKAEKKPSTAEMYRILDSKEPISCDTKAVIGSIGNDDLKQLSSLISNSFEQVWRESFVKTELLKSKPLAVSLSGSGPTWFALFENEADAIDAKESIEKSEIDCFVCGFKERGIEIE